MKADLLSSVKMSIAKAIGVQASVIGVGLDYRSLIEFGDNINEISWMLQSSKLNAKLIQLGKNLGQNLPLCLQLKCGAWVVVVSVDDDKVTLHDPEHIGEGLCFPLSVLLDEHNGRAIILRKSLDRIAYEQDLYTASGHWLWSRIKSKSIHFGSIFAASLIANLLAAVVSLFSLQVYDRVIPNRSEDTLWVLLAGVAIAIFLEALLRVARARVMDRVGRKIDMEASIDLLRHAMAMKITPTTPSASRLAQLMREFATLRDFVTEAAVGAIADIPFALVFVLLIFWIAGPVVIIPIGGIFCMLIPPLLFKRRMLKIVESSLGAQTSAGRLFNEVSYGLETVKVTRAEAFFADQWSDINNLISDAALQQRSLSTKLTQWAASTQQSVYALVVTASVYQVFQGNMTIGAIIATTLMTSRATAPMARLSSVLMRWHQMNTAMRGLDVIFNSPSDFNVDRKMIKRGAHPGRLELRGVGYRYSQEAHSVINIDSLRIQPGERIAILGSNGSGKSTLLRLISGLYTPSSGSISLDDMDINQIDVQNLRHAVSYLPQDTVLFRGTLRDNLKLGRQDLSDDDLFSAAKNVGIDSFIKEHPKGLDMQLSDGGTGLSVGQRQSVGLARILLLNSGTVLLDEPTSSLDNAFEVKMIRQLKVWSHRKTLIVATHRMRITSIVDRVIVMRRGQIILDGPRDEVLAKIFKAHTDEKNNMPEARLQLGNARVRAADA
ncbi:ATP-binding cassette domain-containing protein [Ruegeria sp.]|uniref:ATP-binding cassette domain-containing protein n=1 Tax=Ruegeria sp. TaxID=1879320 RepID=UPI003AFFBE16